MKKIRRRSKTWTGLPCRLNVSPNRLARPLMAGGQITSLKNNFVIGSRSTVSPACTGRPACRETIFSTSVCPMGLLHLRGRGAWSSLAGQDLLEVRADAGSHPSRLERPAVVGLYLEREAGVPGPVVDQGGVQINLELIAQPEAARVLQGDQREAVGQAVPVEDVRKGLRDHAHHPVELQGVHRLLPAGAAGEVLACYDDIGLALQAAIAELGVEFYKGVGGEILRVITLDQVHRRDDVIGIDVVAED